MQNNPLPEKFVERLQLLYAEEELIHVLKAFENKPAPSFRINKLRAQTKDIISELETLGYILRQVPWYKDAFILTNKSTRDLTETDTYKAGNIYIQNLSSMIPALALDPQSDEKILDIAAAPGSKTTQIADLMRNKGEIVANDLSRKRIFRLKDNLEQYGVTNTRIENKAGESIWKRYPEIFDKTLIDVPCSMEGRIQSTDPKSYEDWSPKKIKQLAKLQKYLLRSAISCTKPGGTIVYSTCTLSPEENEEVIAWALEKADGAVVVEKIKLPGIPLRPGLTSWKKKTFQQIAYTARVTPSQEMEGFYIAKLKKLRSTLPIPHIFR